MSPLDRNLAWTAACLLATVSVAWIAFGIQQEGFAPAILFSLLVGGTLGGACVAVRHWTQAPSARVAIVGALVWGLLAVAAQDYIGHRRRARALEEQLAAQGPLGALAHAQVEEFQPGYFDYLKGLVQREPFWWSLDLGLTVASCVAVTAWGARRFPAMQPSS